jgi:hypothetical protein
MCVCPGGGTAFSITRGARVHAPGHLHRLQRLPVAVVSRGPTAARRGADLASTPLSFRGLVPPAQTTD